MEAATAAPTATAAAAAKEGVGGVGIHRAPVVVLAVAVVVEG